MGGIFREGGGGKLGGGGLGGFTFSFLPFFFFSKGAWEK